MKNKDQTIWSKLLSKSSRWCSNTISSNSSCCNSLSICSHLRASFNTQEVMLLSLLVLELTLFTMHLLLKIIIRFMQLNTVNNLSNKMPQALVYKKVSKQFKAQQLHSQLLIYNMAHQLKIRNSKSTKCNLSLNSHSLHSYQRNNSNNSINSNSSNNSSRHNLISHTRDNHRCSSRNKQSSSRLPKST